MYIQTFIFRLHPEVTEETFLPLAAELHDWLRQQPGYASYALYRGQGEWMDQIFWLSEPEAEQARVRFRESSIGQRMLAHVDADHHGFSGSCIDLSAWL